MVIGHFLGIDDLRCIHRCWLIRLNLKALLDHRNKFRHQRCHIIRQIPAVGTGIGHEFLLVQSLRVIQGLLGSESQLPVCFSLKRCQIKQGRGLL